MTIKHILIFFISAIFIYSVFIEPNLLHIKHLTIKSEEVPNIRVVFVSDFHLSKLAKGRLEKIIKTVNRQNADIIISGGDYVINHSAKFSMDMEYVGSRLATMQSKYGFYTVLGNHDYHKDSRYIKRSFKKHGIKILENSNEKIDIEGSPLYIAGISDMQTTKIDLNKALFGTKKPIILVSHSPDITPLAKSRVNLILSGHTHGGQIRVPFYGAVIVPSKYGKRYEAGYKENSVYISYGLGTSIIKARFNCMPEIVVIDFI